MPHCSVRFALRILVAVSCLAILLAARHAAANFIDLAGDFISTDAGPPAGDLETPFKPFLFTAMMAAVIETAPDASPVFGLDRKWAFNSPASTPGRVYFDSLICLDVNVGIW